MKNEHVQREIKAQTDYWLAFKYANAGGFAFACIAGWNGHDGFMFAWWILQIIVVALAVPTLTDRFAERLRYVMFKTQIDNLYVFTLTEDTHDDTVVATFKSTVESLRTVGNQHEVRVHLFMFRDVSIFTWWYDVNGTLQKSSVMRPALSSSESWDEYCAAVEQFERVDRDERLRTLRKDKTGFDWVNKNVFGQWQ